MSDDLVNNHEFLADCCRYAEGVASEQQIKKKWRFDDKTWARLGEDDALVEAIELEKVRRIRSGAAKREKAQQLIVQAVDVLGGIALDPSASAKHRIDASKVLDQFADNGPQAAPAADRFSIVINLGNDQKLKVDRSLGLIPPDGEVIEPDTDTAPQGLLPAIAKKREDNGSGEPL